MECLLSKEQRDLEWFKVSIDTCAAFLRRRTSRNSSKGQEETVHVAVANVKLFFLLSFIFLSSSNPEFMTDTAVCWAVQVKYD